ncbi:serine palmitoyltransferase 1 [Bacillus rossius redtenbacheri]|uniref:serine palmitoyltransferase 1 n=1 Tax=Bacillus rossius redtenbacheri TaxID=93214 RepID=UPI002FDE09F7
MELSIQLYNLIRVIPWYHIVIELLLLVWVLWFLFHRSYNPKELQTFKENEENELIGKWTPEPLVADVSKDDPALRPRIVESKATKYVTVDGRRGLNLASHNYLGLVGDERLERRAVDAVRHYGVGSCGPRGFYGTVDIHLDLEEKLAEFMSMEEAVVYSYGFSTVASAIPAYAKRSDVIYVDEKANFAIQKGVDASRSTALYFKHNDVEDLERILEEEAERELRNSKKKQRNRRKFLVVEGIYMNTGQICPLPELVALAKKYKLRIFVDESISFGSLGSHGKGVTEYFGVPIDDIDLIMGSMEWAMASIGGFCIGSSFVIEHQRLSGLGYCFSASLPPLLAAAAICSLDVMGSTPALFASLRDCCRAVHRALGRLEGLRVGGDPDSPVKHLYLRDPPGGAEQQLAMLGRVVHHCSLNGVVLTVAAYLHSVEKFPPKPSIRVAVNRTLTEHEIQTAAEVIKQAYIQSA